MVLHVTQLKLTTFILTKKRKKWEKNRERHKCETWTHGVLSRTLSRGVHRKVPGRRVYVGTPTDMGKRFKRRWEMVKVGPVDVPLSRSKGTHTTTVTVLEGSKKVKVRVGVEG